MDLLKFNYGNREAVDISEREDVRDVWEPKKYERYRYLPESQFTPENLKEYGEDRTEENLRTLEVTGNSKMMKIYKDLLEEYPQLCVVKLANDDVEGNAFFSWSALDSVSGQVIPVMKFNFSHPETYKLGASDAWLPRNERRDKKFGIKFTMKRLALNMGADWRRCAQNKDLASTMAFLHEMGHAHDFIDNSLMPEYLQREGLPVGMRMAESVAIAARKTNQKRMEGTSSSLGPRETRAEEMSAYREMEDEKYADDFAFDFISEHYDDFFVENDAGGRDDSVRSRLREAFSNKDSRVRMEFGREIPMDADFAYIMGLTKGSRIKVERVLEQEKERSEYDLRSGDYGLYDYDGAKRYDENGEYLGRHVKRVNNLGKHGKVVDEGLVMTTITEGGPIYLKEGDSAVRACSNAWGFRYIPLRDEESGKITTDVFFNDEDGLKYRVERV